MATRTLWIDGTAWHVKKGCKPHILILHSRSKATDIPRIDIDLYTFGTTRGVLEIGGIVLVDMFAGVGGMMSCAPSTRNLCRDCRDTFHNGHDSSNLSLFNEYSQFRD